MESILAQIFTSDYNRTSFEDNVLKPVFLKSVKDFVLYDADGEQEVELTDNEKRTAKKVVKYGEFKTHDNRKIELYEVTVEDFRQVKIARVGLGALVKKLIIGNNAVFATFKYEDVTNKNWRFSFIAYDSFFKDGQVQTKETNPKRYTYVFGDKEETYRTAIDRFNVLDNKFQINVKDIQEAFAVEAMSEDFFDEYREVHYAKFVKYLTGDEFKKKGNKYVLVQTQEPSNFLNDVFKTTDGSPSEKELKKIKKNARNFCKKLLGQIVFLYFLQKKGWMASTSGEYQKADGDKNFLENLFLKSGGNNEFYKSWLSKLFYQTLNTARDKDIFTMPDGKTVHIPFLNGGLFEKDYENLDQLEFPSEFFSSLFDFFNRYNFTVYENGPEEQTVAVDPEMLGHIFENLLEDNKDKGAFYTPKEVVQYMTQESLIEYLVSKTSSNIRNSIQKLIKEKESSNLTEHNLKEIDQLLDQVKICDPAIGSGAFPMGLLQEIFSIKEKIAFDLSTDSWNPAIIKENIIQNSIYGVDIEKGAVDIAQLRFWLSLIVDEEVPKPLPNLAYKIVVGNSLVSKFGDEIIEISWKVDAGNQNDLFGNPYQEELEGLLKEISKKQKEYFNAKKSMKPNLSKEIRLLKLKILGKQIELMISTNPFHKQKGKRLSKSQKNRIEEIESWKRTLDQVNRLKNNEKDFEHFDWRLDFPEILNPLVTDKLGFDIVIGNPPYGVSIKGAYRNSLLKSLGKVPDYEIYYYFTEKAYDLVKKNGVLSFIIPNTYLFNTYASSYRTNIFEKWELVEILDCTKFNIFKNATVRNTVNTWKKNQRNLVGYRKTKNQNTFKDLTSQDRKLLPVEDLLEMNQNWGLAFMLDANIIEIVSRIKKDGIALQNIFPGISQGLIPYDKYRGQSEEIIKSRAYHYKSFDKPNLKKWLWGADITEYKVEWNGEEYIDYCDEIANPRDPIYFQGERLLIREITNPSIFAGITDEELYNDPALIIVKSNDNFSVKWLAAILNSKLASFFHFNYSPKATKGAFPKILVQDIKDFPIKKPVNIEVFSILTDYLIYLKNPQNKGIISHTPNERIASHLLEVIDMMVYELYFENHMKKMGLDVLRFITPEPISEINNIEKQNDVIRNFYLWYQNPENEVRQRIMLIDTRSKDTLAVIKKSVN